MVNVEVDTGGANMISVPPYLCCPQIAVPWLRHGVFGRRGGVSYPPYSALNPSFTSGDDPTHVARNRHLIRRLFGLGEEKFFCANQIHGTKITVITASDRAPVVGDCDGLVTDQPNVGLGVFTADCAPILLVSREPRVFAVVHAGWRGALAGVVENAVQTMKEFGTKDIVGAVGPTIGNKSYEVKEDFRQEMLARDVEASRFFYRPHGRRIINLVQYQVQEEFTIGSNVGSSRRVDFAKKDSIRPDSLRFDLPNYVVHRLRKVGVHANWMGMDVFADPARWHSRRYAMQNGETAFGSNFMMAMISDSN